MITREDVAWFKEQFGGHIGTALQGTPFTLDFLTAIACQETGPIWSALRRRPLPVDAILAACVGDVIDAPGRKAFPPTRAALLAERDGDAMFAIARQALERMAALVPGFTNAVAKPHKFCRGFGVFQYDLQHYRKDPAYFLEQRYLSFPASLGKALDELRAALTRVGLANRMTLGDLELTSVAIAYNAGRFVPERGLKQGHFDGQMFYGERIFDFIRLARTVAVNGASAPLPEPPPGSAALPPATDVVPGGPVFEVDVRETPLRLRDAPSADASTILARLPDGHRVRALRPRSVNGFLEVETSLQGALLRGFAAREFLVAVQDGADVHVPQPSPTMPASGVTAVFMPRHAGTLTRRTDPAGAHSLNEPGQPTRVGTTPDALRREIDAIVQHLAVDRVSHRRYQPRDGLTFCNIYAHDLCHLAGVYLPRVWWTGRSIEALARGETVEPRLGATIVEMRANDLSGWLRDFGLRFGWRRTGTPSKLQLEVNQGALGLIVAHRADDRRPGHVTVVLPETGDLRARRASDGEVVAPLQSQAGATNFQRSTGRAGWWTDEKFDDSSFWLHA